MWLLLSILASTLGVLVSGFIFGNAVGYFFTGLYCGIMNDRDPISTRISGSLLQLFISLVSAALAAGLGYVAFKYGIGWLSIVFAIPGFILAFAAFISNSNAGMKLYR